MNEWKSDKNSFIEAPVGVSSRHMEHVLCSTLDGLTPVKSLSSIKRPMAQAYARAGAKEGAAKILATALFTRDTIFASRVCPCLAREGDLDMPLPITGPSIESCHPQTYELRITRMYEQDQWVSYIRVIRNSYVTDNL